MPETTTPATESATPAETPAAAAPATPELEQKEPDWKAEARKWETRAKENKARLDEAAPKLTEYDRLVEASKTDAERAAEEAARWQTDSQRWRQAALSSRVQALAVDFMDPTDAIGALADTSKYLTAGGEIDDAAIRADLDGVLQSKPHWRRQESGPRPPAPNPAQGQPAGGPVDPASQFGAFITRQLAGG